MDTIGASTAACLRTGAIDIRGVVIQVQDKCFVLKNRDSFREFSDILSIDVPFKADFSVPTESKIRKNNGKS
ncbi:hypothetical protein [Klebsiella phage ST13-OXA48phi12.4]|nr:hypothetical protein [Klebsiella phage ST13-OXA48phi12.4]